MAISWGETAGHQQVGIEVITGAITSTTTTVTVTVKFYVRSISWSFDDNQTLNDSFGDSHNYLFDVQVSTTQQLISSHSFTATPGYSGGPNYTFSASVSGNYTGSNPDHSLSYRLPAKPASVPDQIPALTTSAITATAATIGWSAVDNNGSTIDSYQVQIDDNSNFSSPIATVSVSASARSYTINSLVRSTTYYARVRAHNAIGWASFSPTKTFVTSASAPDTITTLAAAVATPDSIPVSWAAPGSGGSSITGYILQASERSDFTTLAANLSLSSSTTDYVITGLLPATSYYIRIRAVNAIGGGAWSTPILATTLSGAKVKVGNQWRNARVWVKVSGGWVIAKVWKKSLDGTWGI